MYDIFVWYLYDIDTCMIFFYLLPVFLKLSYFQNSKNSIVSVMGRVMPRNVTGLWGMWAHTLNRKKKISLHRVDISETSNMIAADFLQTHESLMAVFIPIKGAKISSNTHHHPFYKTSAEWECNLIETNCSGLKEQACSLHILYQHSEQTGTFFMRRKLHLKCSQYS